MSKSLEYKPESIDTFFLEKSMSYQREIGICFVDLIPTLFSYVWFNIYSWSSVCKAAKADLVFMVDGSWSIGDENFNKITDFLYNTIGALNKIGADGTQVRLIDQLLLYYMH